MYINQNKYMVKLIPKGFILAKQNFSLIILIFLWSVLSFFLFAIDI